MGGHCYGIFMKELKVSIFYRFLTFLLICSLGMFIGFASGTQWGTGGCGFLSTIVIVLAFVGWIFTFFCVSEHLEYLAQRKLK